MTDPDPLPDPDLVQRAVDDVLDEAGHGAPLVRVDAAPPEPAVDETPPWAEKLVRVLDDGLRIPGTDFGVGLDGILGFIFPGIGDFLTGTGSAALLFLALREGVPTVAIGRMVVNIAIDTLGGALPIIGDVFDVFWKSNRKNLELIERYRDEPDAKPGALDYVLVLGGLVLIALSIALPLIVVWLLAGLGVFVLGGD
jgi:hypothetical protein